jgi:DNA-binding MarR family transcriptional regulator
MSPKLEDKPDQELSVDFILAQVGRQQHKRAHDLLEALGLYQGQPRLLRVLWEGEGPTQSELAGRVRVRPATMSKMLQRMEEAGFVERRRDRADQRMVRVYLTEAGHDVQERVQQVWAQMEREVLEGFDEQECRQLRGYLLRIRENLREKENQPLHRASHRRQRDIDKRGVEH